MHTHTHTHIHEQSRAGKEDESRENSEPGKQCREDTSREDRADEKTEQPSQEEEDDVETTITNKTVDLNFEHELGKLMALKGGVPHEEHVQCCP